MPTVLLAAYQAMVTTPAWVSALWLACGGHGMRSGWVLAAALIIVATVAGFPGVALLSPGFFAYVLSVIVGQWLAIFAAATVMRKAGWEFKRAAHRHDDETTSTARRPQLSIREVILATVVFAMWLAVYRQAVSLARFDFSGTGSDASMKIATQVAVGVRTISSSIVNAIQISIAALTIGRNRKVLPGFLAVLAFSVAGLTVFEIAAIITGAPRVFARAYLVHNLTWDVCEFLLIGLAMLWLRRRGYDLECGVNSRPGQETNDAAITSARDPAAREVHGTSVAHDTTVAHEHL
ncbi:MAG: hypothetical protein KDA63_12570 [Planctomycetales bacterium]|nr:hypothetical protein [Planctomycetales bacterium]